MGTRFAAVFLGRDLLVPCVLACACVCVRDRLVELLLFPHVTDSLNQWSRQLLTMVAH